MNRLAAELNPDDTVLSHFFYATQSHSPDGMIRSGVKYLFVKDRVGSVRMVVNSSSGAIMQMIDYDEFGVVLSDSNPGYQPFGFAGGIYDSETKLVRFGARDYDAEVGRWTAKDPILFKGQMANLYGYNFNDPVNFIDPDGKNPLVIAPIVGAIVGGAASFTGTLLGGGTFSDAVDSIPGGALAGGAATVTALAAIAGGIPTGAAVITGAAVDLLISVATAPDP